MKYYPISWKSKKSFILKKIKRKYEIYDGLVSFNELVNNNYCVRVTKWHSSFEHF